MTQAVETLAASNPWAVVVIYGLTAAALVACVWAIMWSVKD